VAENKDGAVRFRMLETIRAYAQEKLLPRVIEAYLGKKASQEEH
jgi:predicted ATPase